MSRPGRLEEVERVARGRRVEHEQVEVALLRELVELGDRGELLRAGDGARELAVDAVALDLLGALGRRGEPLDQLVERPLGVEHHRPQLTLERPRRSRPGRRGGARSPARRGRARWPGAWPGRSSRPRPSAPRRPCPSAIAADVVVLPTPPEPPQTQTRVPSSSSATLPAVIRPASRASASARRSASPSASPNRNGSSTPGTSRRALAQPRELLALGRRRARARTARPPARPRRRRPPGRAPVAAARLRVAEALGQSALTNTALELQPVGGELVAQPQRLVDRHLLGDADGDDRGEAGRRPWRRSAAPGRRSARRARSRRTCAACAGSRPVPGRGRVDDHQVVRVRAAGVPRELGELVDLADAEQLPHPGRRHRERLEQPAGAERLAERAGLDPQVLLHRGLGVDRDRVEALGELHLLEALAGLGERPPHPVLAGELGDDRAPSLPGRAQSERGGDRRLADAALPGDEDQAAVEQSGHGAGNLRAPDPRPAPGHRARATRRRISPRTCEYRARMSPRPIERLHRCKR